MKRLLCFFCCSLVLIVASAQTEEPTTLCHIVRRGESLNLLSERFGVTPNQLSALNDDATDFYAGMRVTLPFPPELRGKSDGVQPLDDYILSELYHYRDLCTQADSFFAHSEFNNAHAYYDEAIQGYDGYFDCSGAKYARAVCSYHAKNWETARREFDRVIDGGLCSEQVLAVAKAYREVCSQHEKALLEHQWAAEAERKERRRERWRNFGAGLVQVAGAVAQAYVQTKYASENSGGYASSGDLTAGLDPESPGYASAVVARSSLLNAPIPEAFNPACGVAMAQPVYSFDTNGNMMVSYPGFSQVEAEMNAAVQHSLGSSNPALSASLNRMSALSQQFWNTPMYPEAWAATSSSSLSSPSSSATVFSTSTSSSEGSTTNTNMGNRCRKLSSPDIAHCGGSGVCARCNGNKKYFNDSPYVNHWVDCSNCGKTGKCPSCGGKGLRY